LVCQKKTKECIFDRYSQGNRYIFGRHGGSGLGLALSKKLVHLLGGEIDVVSQKGKGSTFCFTIHCDKLTLQEEQNLINKAKAASPSIPALPLPEETSKSILLVEDNPVNQRILCHFLKEGGYVYEIANNGEEAVALFKAKVFDLVLMDIEMPVMNGYKATKRIRQIEKRENRQRVPIICLSGYARELFKEKAHQVGMDEYVTKPLQKRDLLDKITVLIQLKQKQFAAQTAGSLYITDSDDEYHTPPLSPSHDICDDRRNEQETCLLDI